ncbi:dihydroneopterin triphosphate pyrophosphatase [Frederiksenia canicola]|uniref:Dihydroneopterin triphosphate pyrophosphatase n=2 Tax=Frederiksenia canicola TaxID=123824 RepID=A0ABX9XTZ2_9PAST|nr:dihydroneopterin triphosphate pyrophosphatase [Frederiksenia canicola]
MHEWHDKMNNITNYKNPHSVLIVVYAKDTGRVLMLQRQDDPEFWQSVTGTIETGETPYQTAIREVGEEIGLQILAEKLPLVDCQHRVEFEIFPQFRYKYAPEISHCTEHWFLLALENEIIPQLTEHLAYQWLTVEQAVRLTKSPNNAQAIGRYLGDKLVG